MSELVKNISSAVFKVNTASGSGSGFYLNSKKIIVTNCHVVMGYKEVSIEDNNQNRYLAKVVMINSVADIAFLKPDRDFDKPTIEIADITGLKSRDSVYVLGFPFGMPYTETKGIVSNPHQLMDERYYIQTDAAVNPGNSGGPVVNSAGQVVGITTCKFTEADNMGFAIPADALVEELQSLDQNPDFVYAVKCNSCKSLIIEETEYCQNCGNKIDEKLYKMVKPTKIEEFVESALKDFGVNPVLARVGYEFWEFHQGSALVRIFIFDKNYLYTTSPLNNLPITNLDKLFKYMLSNPIAPYQLGVYKNQIFISYREHLSDVFSPMADAIKKNIVNILSKADEMDDYFEKEFGCPKSNYAKKSN